MEKYLRIFFWKKVSKVKAIYRINQKTKTETFKKEAHHHDIFFKFQEILISIKIKLSYNSI